MAGLIPAMHVFPFGHAIETWMPGTRPGRTECNGSPKRLFQELLELRQVFRHLPDRGRGRGRPTRIAHCAVPRANLIKDPLQKDVNEEPRAHIARLLLAPDHLRLLET